MLLGLALLFAAVAGFNPALDRLNRPARYFGQWTVMSIIYFVVALVWFWQGTPSFTGALFGMGWAVLIAWIINLVVDGASDGDPSVTGILIVVLWAIVVVSTTLGSCAGPRWSLESKMIGNFKTINWKNEFTSPTNPKHARLVRKQHAVTMMKKLMAQSCDPRHPDEILGSLYELDEDCCTMQKYRNRLEWVCPLKFKGDTRRVRDYIPGYARISAEDPTDVAEFVSEIDGKKIEMRYMPTARFQYRLDWHVWASGYVRVNVVDYTFETDDNGRPYWGLTRTMYKSLGAGEYVVGTLLVDPMSGKITPYDANKTPAWIDRIVPRDLAREYVQNWGRLRHKWRIISRDPEAVNVVKEGPIEIFGDDGNIYWHIGVTSPSSKDDALKGFFHINTRTGVAKYYRMKVAACHGESALENAKQAIATRNMRNVHPGDPVPYLLFGRLAYLTPADGNNGLFQCLVITDAENQNHVGIGRTAEEALNSFREALAQGGGAAQISVEQSIKTGTFTVARASLVNVSGTSHVAIRVTEVPSKNFVGALAANRPDLPFVKEGDKVEVGYLETGDTECQIMTFDIPALK